MSRHADDGGGELLLQRYDASGGLLRERSIVTGDDPVLSAHVIGYPTSGMALLVKRSNARWGIWWIGLSALRPKFCDAP